MRPETGVAQLPGEGQGGGQVLLQQAPKARVVSFDSNPETIKTLSDQVEEEET
ncbi:MAG: hypothetical protein NTV33_00240 [Coprothermobacterota bacterium]|nr:hypothetical protein [Coprothermobacterota bacterium]